MFARRVLGVASAAVAAWWAVLAGPANAASPQLSVTASGATYVGLQIFANVNLFGASHPSGNATFRLFAPNDTSCTSAIFTSTVPVTSTSVNSSRWTTNAAGTYRWEVSYSGDGANGASGPTACSLPSAAVIVSPASTALAVTAEAPSGGTMRANAALTGTAHPTGTVTFFLSPPGDTFCSTTVFTSAVPAHGAGSYASAPFSATATGTYKWRASYSGDANNAAALITACLSPGAAVTVSSVASPPHPTATPAPSAPRPATSTTVTASHSTATALPIGSTPPPPAPATTGAPQPSSGGPSGAAPGPRTAAALAAANGAGGARDGPPWLLITAVSGVLAAAAVLVIARAKASRRAVSG